jgi:hypothetical protein
MTYRFGAGAMRGVGILAFARAPPGRFGLGPLERHDVGAGAVEIGGPPLHYLATTLDHLRA